MALKILDQYTEEFANREDIQKLAPHLEHHHKSLVEHTGTGNDFHGWMDLPERMLDDEQMWKKLDEIKQKWTKLAVTHIVVIGIGGSYLGAKALYEALKPPFSRQHQPQLVFAGHQMSAAYLDDLCVFLKNTSFGLIVISKSGTTLEPAMAFRILRNELEKQFGKQQTADRIVAITDAESGALRSLTNKAKWPSFIIEDSVGGRYSVFSPVGIVPLFLVGIDMKTMLNGALEMQNICVAETKMENNPALHYAALRYHFYNTGKPIEILASFQPELQYLAEWWKQLFGESDGKQHRGIFPASVIFSTDLHSMGQYIQDGMRAIFETFVLVKNKPGLMMFPGSENNEDGLDYLAGKSVSYINGMAEEATMLAHVEGGVPVIGISIDDLGTKALGELLYFFKFSCAIGGYLLGVNPFDQPGVETYKKNMFALLGKPGMEEESREILNKLQKSNG